MSEGELTGRRPWMAVVLSLLSTGLGHIYCGRVVTGLVLFLASLLFAPSAVLAANLSPSLPVLLGLLLCFAGVLAVYVYSVVDAWRVARRLRHHYEPKEYNRGVVYALFILVGASYPAGVARYLRANVFEAYRVPTASQVPNILAGDRVLVNKVVFPGRFPRRGDVVVFRAPGDRDQAWIKRVIALPGDTVAVRDNQVYLNGRKLERDPVPAASLSAIKRQARDEVFYETNAGSRYMVMLGAEPGWSDFAERTVPEGHCFLLGDNRDNSTDSREFGFVPVGDVFGLVQYVYYPAETWARFGPYRD